eukprot:Opistho-2@92952
MPKPNVEAARRIGGNGLHSKNGGISNHAAGDNDRAEQWARRLDDVMITVEIDEDKDNDGQDLAKCAEGHKRIPEPIVWRKFLDARALINDVISERFARNERHGERDAHSGRVCHAECEVVRPRRSKQPHSHKRRFPAVQVARLTPAQLQRRVLWAHRRRGDGLQLGLDLVVGPAALGEHIIRIVQLQRKRWQSSSGGQVVQRRHISHLEGRSGGCLVLAVTGRSVASNPQSVILHKRCGIRVEDATANIRRIFRHIYVGKHKTSRIEDMRTAASRAGDVLGDGNLIQNDVTRRIRIGKLIVKTTATSRSGRVAVNESVRSEAESTARHRNCAAVLFSDVA